MYRPNKPRLQQNRIMSMIILMQYSSG